MTPPNPPGGPDHPDPPRDPLGVTIGAREIYDKLGDVDRKVDRLIGDHDTLRAQAADHENRLRSLERARWPLPSLAVLIALASLTATILSLLTKG